MAYKSVYQRALEQFEKAKDLCTKQQRKLLDQLQQERKDMGKLKFIGRGLTSVSLMRSPGHSGYCGVYCVSWDWVKQEIKRCCEERLAEEKQEVANQIGAFI